MLQPKQWAGNQGTASYKRVVLVINLKQKLIRRIGYNNQNMRRIFLLFFLTILWTSGLGFPQKTVQAQAGNAYDLIDMVNGLRVSHDGTPFTLNGDLMASAQAHADYLAASGIVSHVGSGGTKAADRAYAAGYGGGKTVYISENTSGGMNQSLEDIVYNVWSDDLHMQTMIDPSYYDIGAGVSTANGWTYYVLDVGFVSGVPALNNAVQAATTGMLATKGTLSPTIKPSVTSNVKKVDKATPQEDGSVIHEVKAGQAVWSIALEYGLTVAELISLNNLPADPVLQIGQKLVVVPPYTPTATPTASSTPKPPTPTPTQTLKPITFIPTSTPTLTQTPTSQPLFVGVDSLKAINRRDMGIGLVILCAAGLAVIVYFNLRNRKEEKSHEIDPIEELLSDKQEDKN